jgi:hypothetical protein
LLLGDGMLGCCIGVYRQKDISVSPGKSDPPEGARLAVWQTGLGGLDWLNELVKAGKAIDLGGNGYPNRYTGPRCMSAPADHGASAASTLCLAD